MTPCAGRPLAATTLLVASLAHACTPDVGRPDLRARSYLRVVEAEDARPAAGEALRTLVKASRAHDPFLRGVGVRALGRLENPSLVDSIRPALADALPEVRAEAANALAQSVHRGEGGAVLGPLLVAAMEESDPHAAAAIARALGRLAITGPLAFEVERILVRLSRAGGDPGPDQVLGAALGMESWTRRNGGTAGAVARQRALELTVYRADSPDETSALVRTVSWATVARLGLAGSREIRRGLSDPSEAARAAATVAIAGVDPIERDALLRRALADVSSRVRTEAIRVLSALPVDARTCAALRTAAADPDVRAASLAVDALARPCPDDPAVVTLLERLAASMSSGPTSDWHLGGHALVSLASVAPERARTLLPEALAHPNPFARSYAARAAGATGDVASLRGLLRDPDSNVATRAVSALHAVGGRSEDGALIDLLGTTDDAQVVVTAAPLLHDSELRREAAEAAFTTLRRLTEPRWETLRDPRVALLELVEAVADSTRLDDVEPYLRDFDEAVATTAASVMESWTGKPFLGAPRAPPSTPLPTVGDLRAMARSEVVLHMARGGRVVIELLPLEAATNAFRLYSLARDGRLDGLTLHRVVPNFVVQGGSPRGNEYGGHGPFTRDELGLRVQRRGTVGLSTRGRDTGDGQIYFNLIDNVGLDHDYTLLGVVVSGMDVVDRVLEGDVIERAEVVAR